MKILKLLNKKNFLILFFLFFTSIANAEEKPVDIWNIDKKEIEEKNTTNNSEISNGENILQESIEPSVFGMQNQNQKSIINLDEKFDTKEIKIIGLYDPEDYGLNVDMWANSDGDQLENLLTKLNKMDLSNDAIEIINTSLLINAHSPKKNISDNEFLKLKSDWLIKNSNLDLIEEYLIQNQIINLHPELTKHLVDEHLSNSKIDKACSVFSKNNELITDEYLSKFNIYCLIKNNKREEAQLILDLKKETGFKDEYFEKKINYLLKYTKKIDDSVSEKSIFDFYLAHQTNPNFKFEPNDKTKKIICSLYTILVKCVICYTKKKQSSRAVIKEENGNKMHRSAKRKIRRFYAILTRSKVQDFDCGNKKSTSIYAKRPTGRERRRCCAYADI